MPTNHHAAHGSLWEYVTQGEPSAIVLAGDPPIDVNDAVPGMDVLRVSNLQEQASVISDALSALGNGGPDRAVLVLTLDRIHAQTRMQADRTLGLAIRQFPWQALVHCSDARISHDQFYAFGFRRLPVRAALADPVVASEQRFKNQVLTGIETDGLADSRWYEYRLSHYKRAPDWLNARFWANPERFDEPESDDDYDDEEFEDDP